MSTNDLLEYKFSPLYRVRKVIFILRWCLGFPLKAKNVAFDEVLFRPCVEYARFCAFLLSFAVSISFVLFKVKESNNLESFGAAYNYYYRVVGFTAYDSIAVLSAPYTNMLATVFYLIAFKNNVSSISDQKVNRRRLHFKISTKIEVHCVFKGRFKRFEVEHICNV